MPNNSIYNFDGNMEFRPVIADERYNSGVHENEKIALSNENVLLRGM